jgi:hypothetical protein
MTGQEGEERLIAIGTALAEKGGEPAMLAAFKKARNLAHRRFGYTGSARLLEMPGTVSEGGWGDFSASYG